MDNKERAKSLETITREEFTRYEGVRSSGVLNMWDSRVPKLAGISPEAHIGVIAHYSALNDKWPDVRKEDED